MFKLIVCAGGDEQVQSFALIHEFNFLEAAVAARNILRSYSLAAHVIADNAGEQGVTGD